MRSFARVTIDNDDVVRNVAERVARLLHASTRMMQLGTSSWAEQFSAAVRIGGAKSEVRGSADCIAWVSHILALPWKLIVACVPPTSLGDGKPCFVAAIVLIGAITALIGDLANLLGCAIGLKNSVVAITLVALGTSLPDMFASRAAALGDKTADAVRRVRSTRNGG